VSVSSSPFVAIVILNWNNASDTLECLNSLLNMDYPDHYPIVVDNGSTDNSAAEIRMCYPDIHLQTLAENLGYAEGNNIGIRHAINCGADYILILNNDTIVSPNMLIELVQVAESNPRVGMVGPTVYFADEANTIYAAGSFIDWANGRIWHRGMYQPASLVANFRSPEKVGFIAGCGVLVNRKLIETIGPLNPLYYLNYEDVEWCVRASNNGYEVWYVPQAEIWHKDSATMGHGSPAHIYYLTRNALLFYWQNSPSHLRWVTVSRHLLSTLRTIGAWSVKSEYKNDICRRKRTAKLLATRDFFLGRFHKMGPDVAAVCYPAQ
jgi:GT2 family glycosyltransferase